MDVPDDKIKAFIDIDLHICSEKFLIKEMSKEISRSRSVREKGRGLVFPLSNQLNCGLRFKNQSTS
jgi:hypothetical protein